MRLIDADGNLFGVANIIDVFVVLLVLTVVASGGAFLLSSGDDAEKETRYATLDLGTQPTYVAGLITEGDTETYNNGNQISVTDVYVTDEGDQKHVLVRVALNGTISPDGEFFFDGEPPRVGRTLRISTEHYTASGRLTAVGRTEPKLALVETTVVLEGTMSSRAASLLSENDTVVRGGRAIASVESFQLYDTDSANEQRVIVLMDVLAYRYDRSLRMGSNQLQLGQKVSWDTGEYSLEGSIATIGATELPTAERDVLLRTRMPVEEAASLSVGDTYEVSGRKVAEIKAVDAYGVGNADARLVFVGVTYITYEPRERPHFSGVEVREGVKLPFRTEAYEFEGRVVRTNALEQRGEETEREVTLEIEGARLDLIDNLEVGMREQVGGETIAVISNVTSEPADVVLTSDDGNVYLREHPLKKDVTIEATIQVRETVNGLTYKGESVRPGDTILIDLGTITIQATVTSI